MNPLSLLHPHDPELVAKTLARLQQQDEWNDVFATKLFGILDNIDRFQASVRGHLMLPAELERIRAAAEQAAPALVALEQTQAAHARTLARLDEARAELDQAALAHRQASDSLYVVIGDAERANAQRAAAQERLDAAAELFRRARAWGRRVALVGIAGFVALALGGWAAIEAGARWPGIIVLLAAVACGLVTLKVLGVEP